MRLEALIVLVVVISAGKAEVVFNDPFGSFSSPNYPNVYANDLNETWRINVRPGRRIRIQFTTFDLEDSYEDGLGPCIYDYVQITEGTKEIARFCGNSMNYPMDAPRSNEYIYTDGNNATVQFVSDYSNEDISPTGFLAHFAEIDIDECADMRRKEMYVVEDWDELLTCDHYCNNVPGSFYCSCATGYTLHADKHTCIATFCENQELTADEGIIEIPTHRGKYPKYADCLWHIMVRDGLSVHLTFVGDFAVEEHVDEGCVYDILKIAYKNREESYCGTTAPSEGQVMDMNTRDVSITFTSDRSVEMSGFKIIYNNTRIRCQEELTNPQHRSKSPNPKGYYEFEDVVTFVCDIGYEFEPGASSTLECLSNGEWNHPQPLCQIKVCGRPQKLLSVDYSSIVDLDTKRFEYGETVTVVCDQWYEMTAGHRNWTCQDSKEWEGETEGMVSDGLPKCRPKCGSRFEKEDTLSPQIAGGKQVKQEGGFPWMAFIDKGEGIEGENYCGGSLVDEKTVVTAAHCVDEIDIGEEISVWLGVRDRQNVTGKNYIQEIRVPEENIHVIESFRTNQVVDVELSFDEDIAVLKFDRPANLSYYVRPICVPATEQQQVGMIRDVRDRGRTAVVTGWGLDEQNSHSRYLLKTRVPFVDINRCRSSYINHFPTLKQTPRRGRIPEGELMITDNMICAGPEHGRNDACEGDSGGPLMTKADIDQKWYLNGIVSFGDNRRGCGKSDTYGVYTDVGKFTDFLSANMEK